MKWQPIETAPKDGTEIFFFRDDFGVGICCWLWAGEVCPKDEYGDPLGDYDEEFYVWADRAYGWVEESGKITHWMPLPEPPNENG